MLGNLYLDTIIKNTKDMGENIKIAKDLKKKRKSHFSQTMLTDRRKKFSISTFSTNKRKIRFNELRKGTIDLTPPPPCKEKRYPPL